MNKTFTINLNGRVYHINDDAFDMLNNYLDKLKQRFSKEEGSQEIMDDIEARIGELFTERMRYGMNVICISDVEDMIKVMGEPEQYDEEISIEEEKTSEVSEKGENKSGNINDTTSDKKTKKLFRDPDHRVIAGVCAGLGSYTGIDPIILRLVFIISFFCLYGSTILVYVLFWILMPEARTVAQKLQMKGEEPNVENIRQAITESENNSVSPKRSALSETLGFIVKFVAIIAGFILGVILLIILFYLGFFALMGSFMNRLMNGMIMPGYDPGFIPLGPGPMSDSIFPPFLAFISSLIIIVLPIYCLIHLILVKTRNVKPMTKPTAWTFLAIWVAAIIAFVIYLF